MLWMVVPVVLGAGAFLLLRAVHDLDAARRDLQVRVAGLADARAEIADVRSEIDATLAAVAAREHR